MNYNQMVIRSLPFQWLFIVMVVSLALGCSSSHSQRQEAAKRSFGTNLVVEVKATTYVDQFIVRCEDGSIWEVKASMSLDAMNDVSVIYKNCLPV